jgi:FMN phosphatase YigB (HAD superfamily)
MMVWNKHRLRCLARVAANRYPDSTMALTLEKYITDYLPTRNLPWPAMPKVVAPKARPALQPLGVKAILWNVYGTLLAIPTGELQFEADIEFVTDAAFDKTIQEFKMWNSMSRKPGAPSAYMKELFRKAYDIVRLTSGGEPRAELVWDDIVRKLMTKEFTYDAAVLGTPAELNEKIAYFYHASIQGVGCYTGAADTLRMCAERGLKQGLLADGQCFTPAQLKKALKEQDPGFELATAIPANLITLSHQHKVKKPSEELFKMAVSALRAKGIQPSETLHVGSHLIRDIAPAKKLGMKTALFAGDKASLVATSAQMQEAATRPDAMLTELPQVLELLR